MEIDLTKELPAYNTRDCISAFIPANWKSIVLDAVRRMVEIDPEVEIVQIKSKFGQLRLYFVSMPDSWNDLDKVVIEAEEKIKQLQEDNDKCPTMKIITLRNAERGGRLDP